MGNKQIVIAVVGTMLSVVLFAQSARTPGATSASWLHPSDAAYIYAINDGFGKKHTKHKYLEVWHHSIQFDPASQVEATFPLYCAFKAASAAWAKLVSRPSLADVKAQCDGQIEVSVVHFATNLDAHYRVVFDVGGSRVQPSDFVPDHNPAVVSFMSGWLSGNDVGYEYSDLFVFRPSHAWTGEVTMVLADQFGKRKMYKFPMGGFAKEASALGTAPAVASK